MDDKKIKQIQKLLDVAEGNLHSACNLILEILGEKRTGKVDHTESAKDLSILDEGKIIEGIFDGEQMVSPDGKKYPVPANYASKSKLVEGDILKLTISEDGSLLYKQINPVERKNLIGTLSYDDGNYSVLAEGKSYKVLFASVTYYKGEPGNSAAIIIPDGKDSTWAAIESIIHEHNESKNVKKEEEKVEKPSNEDTEEESAADEKDYEKSIVDDTPLEKTKKYSGSIIEKTTESRRVKVEQDKQDKIDRKKAEETPPVKVEEEEVKAPVIELDLPAENKEILEEINQKYSEEGDFAEGKTKIFGESKEKKTVLEDTGKAEPLSEGMTVQEAAKAVSEEAEATETAEKKLAQEVKVEATYTPEPDPVVKPESETNSVGEKTPSSKESIEEIKELEI